MKFENIILEQEQKDLLATLVEAARNVSQQQRRKFVVAQSSSGDTCIHPGLPGGHIQIYMGDVEILASAGLLNLFNGLRGSPRFDVNPTGFAYYGYLKRQIDQPVKRIETAVRDYLVSDRFQQRYPLAYKKWSEAEALLWISDSQNQLTTIGHLCREAIQEFATTLVDQFKPLEVNENKAHDVNRIRAVLQLRASQLGDTERSFLDALLEYWRTVSSLIQAWFRIRQS